MRTGSGGPSVVGSAARVLLFGAAVALGVVCHAVPLDAQGARDPVGVAFDVPSGARSLRLVAHLYRPDGPGPFRRSCCSTSARASRHHLHRWGRTLRQWGCVVLLPDSFGPRKETGVCERTGSTSVSAQHERMPDAYAAKSYLARQSFVDPHRIALMGWHHGGWALLYAIDDVFLTEIAAPPFRAAIGLYPGCHGGTRRQKLNAPLLILVGGADDLAPPSMCRDFLARSGLGESSTPHAATVRVYPGAYAWFDDADLPRRQTSYTVGGHPEAARLAEADVKQFLATHLGIRRPR